MNLLSVFDARDILFELLDRAEELKKGAKARELSARTLGLLFEKASTRTRVSFEVAMTQLGGHSIYLNPREMQMGRGESVADTARTLSRYLDAVAIRAMRHGTIVEFAAHSRIPVINALTDLEHPCQALSDLLTIREKKGGFDVKLAYIGDGNNVCNSLIAACAMAGVEVAVATPKGYEPDQKILRKAKDISTSTINITHDPAHAVAGADIVYTDVWVSMGQEHTEAERIRDFRGYQVNRELLKASKDALVMHCLPARRGLEITDEVLDGPSSIVFEQAENRLHLQKALLEMMVR